ncbi:inosine-uridine preferring nucleoside hydrolase-like isoform X3 [Elysia marginata]|uniref:Inosine-uridine preferring nucleoside hydrolase-like isoform X3 n=1 Tax=Elysia marginata TaxID=1093978 RepID=A0AAV4JD67_9GAST|nr:inosine-uridine preferring nucleoside hydrolase-like isoform X3 [Elysia marginata]
MPLRMEPGQIYQTWAEFKLALDAHCAENKCLFSISNAKSVEQANRAIKKRPYFDIALKYASCILVCKHYGSYTSASKGLRPKQRTYKTNCKAYINVSACRKENYLIIRDACHLHTHPCIDEIYSSYPEIRRMSKDEKKMVGFLLELGVPPSQIKTAVGRHVTPKDLQNAKTQLKTLKQAENSERSSSMSDNTAMELESDDTQIQKSTSQMLQSSEDSSGGELIREVAEDGKMLREVMTSVDNIGSGPYIVSVGGLQDSLDDEVVVEDSGGDQGDQGDAAAVLDAGGLSGLLAAAGINSDSVVVTMNSQPEVKQEEPDAQGNNSAYTVTLCLPGGDVSKKGNNLQELLKGLPLGRIVSKPSSAVTLPDKHKTPQGEETSTENYKLCSECKGYVSPLDTHDRCLSCLGPEHIQEENCQHCKAMSPEQFNIRRKKMVALRMKALKALQQKRKLEELKQQEQLSQTSDETADSDPDFGQRRSKRVRKPKSFGPDVTIENFGRKQKISATKGEQTHSSSDPVIKSEPLCEYEDGFTVPESQLEEENSGNAERFAHILSQTSVFDDVGCTELEKGLMAYTPEQTISKDFQRLIRTPNLPAVPPSLLHKYKLDPTFEADFCSPPEPLRGSSEPGVDIMNRGLCKLAVNATTNTRLAVYDKLFTRLGVGMADEALSILTELYGKVTHVTEISQEDLTSNLQTAMDTILALKDVLEELGVMSQDAVQTAAYQRSLSLQSLSKARTLLEAKQLAPRDTSLPRRSKFTPFSTKKLSVPQPVTELNNQATSIEQELTKLEQEDLEVPSTTVTTSSVEVLATTQTETSSSMETAEVPIITMAGPQSTIEVATEPESTFINMENKLYSITPMTMSNELFHTLSNTKDSTCGIDNVGW